MRVFLMPVAFSQPGKQRKISSTAMGFNATQVLNRAYCGQPGRRTLETRLTVAFGNSRVLRYTGTNGAGTSMTANHRQGIACGVWVVDLVKVVDQYPQEDSIAYISEMSRGGGGAAHNVVISLARFDANPPLYALGLIGTDAYGDYLVEECRAWGDFLESARCFAVRQLRMADSSE